MAKVWSLDLPGITLRAVSGEVGNKKLESDLYPENEKVKNKGQKAKQRSRPPVLSAAYLLVPAAQGERGTRHFLSYELRPKLRGLCFFGSLALGTKRGVLERQRQPQRPLEGKAATVEIHSLSTGPF